MASTIQLQRTFNLVQTFLRLAPVTNVGGFPLEPGFSNADWVRNFILSPPFAWRWNRATTTFQTAQGLQDYSVSLPSFGWLEKATINDGSAHELEIVLNLGEETIVELPTKISARLDDGNGNITFRLSPAPPKPAVVTLAYQQASAVFANLTDTWKPIPDYLSYLYNTGMLAKSYEYFNDERYPFTMQLFVRQVIAASEGLKESQVNIFLAERIATAREMQETMGNSASGRQGRGLF